MSVADRQKWDAQHKARAEQALPAPDPLLLQFTPPLRDSSTEQFALDLACGLGQNGLWLAQQGYITTLMDISRVALNRVRDEAAVRSLRNLNLFQIDLESANFDARGYDLICVFRFVQRDLIPKLRAAVKPGGRIIYESFNTRMSELKPDFTPDYLLDVGELAGSFGDWRVIHASEAHQISQIVAIKPG